MWQLPPCHLGRLGKVLPPVLLGFLVSREPGLDTQLLQRETQIEISDAYVNRERKGREAFNSVAFVHAASDCALLPMGFDHGNSPFPAASQTREIPPWREIAEGECVPKQDQA